MLEVRSSRRYYQRQRTGEGQEIEISMQEAMTYFMRSCIGAGSEWGSKVAKRSGNRQGLPPVNAYPRANNRVAYHERR